MNKRQVLDQTSSSLLVKKVSFWMTIRNYIIFAFLSKLNKKNTKKGFPKLLALPNDYIGRHIITQGIYEEHVLTSLFENFLKDYHSDFLEQTALDIGANIGNHSCYFANYFDSIISFEPNYSVFSILKANIAINDIENIIPQNYGLSHKDEELVFMENRDGNLGGSTFCEEYYPEKGEKKILSVKKGDTILLEKFPEKNIKVIKIDIEGHEMAALKGLENTIMQFNPIILFESHTSQGPTGGKEIFNYLKSLGYDYFYSIERKQNKSKFKFIRIIERIFSSYSIYVQRIIFPENRLYLLIVASKTAITNK